VNAPGTLLVDVGNTRIKWRPAGADRVEADLHAGGLAAVLAARWAALPAPRRVLAASVAGAEHDRTLADWVAARWSLPVEFIVARAHQAGVRNGYDEPARLGADRWAALIGAHHGYPGPACVVDCGTAVTIDALTADGEFLGGVILPGLALAREALTARTPIREVDAPVADCFARATAPAVAAGTLYGLAGAIERVAREQGARLGPATRLLLTGGDGERLRPYLDGRLPYAVVAAPALVLKGLAVIASAP